MREWVALYKFNLILFKNTTIYTYCHSENNW